jgi:cytidylate kinase
MPAAGGFDRAKLPVVSIRKKQLPWPAGAGSTTFDTFFNTLLGWDYNFFMDLITLITGSPGTGKTAVSSLLAARSERGAHIPTDLFYTFPAHLIPPHLAAANEQNQVVIAAALQAAASLARHGYDVYLDGILGPWFLPFIASELAPLAPAVHYVVLGAPLETAQCRVRGRSGALGDDVVRQMHPEFENAIGKYVRQLVDVERLSVAEAADTIVRSREQGDFLPPLNTIGIEF